MSDLQQLGWDSDFFDIPIARVVPGGDPGTARRAAQEADAVGIECTYHQVDADDGAALASAQAAGFRVVDVRVELAREVLPAGAADPGVRPATPEDAAWVVADATHRFQHSRFATDPRFGPDAAQRLFARWAERGFADPDRRVLVTDDRTGFVICAYDDEGWIDLIAARDGAPRGTGGRLVTAALADYAGRDLATAAVVTQAANIGALRLYERAGYRVRSSSYWLHRWREQPGG